MVVDSSANETDETEEVVVPLLLRVFGEEIHEGETLVVSGNSGISSGIVGTKEMMVLLLDTTEGIVGTREGRRSSGAGEGGGISGTPMEGMVLSL
jgi:hypothetical protein